MNYNNFIQIIDDYIKLLNGKNNNNKKKQLQYITYPLIIKFGSKSKEH